jgi:MSHA pilin protein MshD
MSANSKRGVSLIELVVFIAIAGIAMAALFSVLNTMTARSADPQVRKQLLAIAESLMEEVQLMPFTFCDPDDAHAATATSAAVTIGTTDTTICTALSEDSAIGPEGETRYHATLPFDNVSDYHGFSMSPIVDLAGVGITQLNSYQASIAVAQVALGTGVTGTGGPVPLADSLRITVTVTGPQGTQLKLEGYRTRYAPNTLP